MGDLNTPKQVLDIATEAGSTCSNKKLIECRAGFTEAFLDSNGIPNPTKVCESGKMKKCFRYVAPQLGLKNPCKGKGDTTEKLTKLVEGIFTIPNVVESFFDANKDDIAEFLVEDLKLNIPGLVDGDDLDLNLTVTGEGSDATLHVSFTISGSWSFAHDFSISEAVKTLKDLWLQGQSFFPNTDVFAMGLMATTDKRVAAVMGEVVLAEEPGTTTTPTDDNTGSSSSASLSMSLFASAGAVFLAVLLAM